MKAALIHLLSALFTGYTMAKKPKVNAPHSSGGSIFQSPTADLSELLAVLIDTEFSRLLVWRLPHRSSTHAEAWGGGMTHIETIASTFRLN